MVGAFLGLFIGLFLMCGQIAYPTPKAMPPVSMIGCTNATTTERFIYPVDPDHK